MGAIPVIAVFDIGKTNKKIFLFDEDYKVVYERSSKFNDIDDEDGFPCEDLESLSAWVLKVFGEVTALSEFDIKAVNFSAYGASFVYIDEEGKPLTHLYNYLKPYPEKLKNTLYKGYGGEVYLSGETASPVLGSLNSGMQLYRLKYEQPAVFKRVKYALHLPQYLSFLLTRQPVTDITSIGCHTGLWDFSKSDYHQWVKNEGLVTKFAPVAATNVVFKAEFNGKSYQSGIGLHDSSAALIPYLVGFDEPFLLLSTGTWNISLNPFNSEPLTPQELVNDCLCYLQYKGRPVKASRLMAGLEHEQQVDRIAAHFNTGIDVYKNISLDTGIIARLQAQKHVDADEDVYHLKRSAFAQRDLAGFANYTEAYHQLVLDLVEQQHESTQYVLKGTNVRKIFVDGGFSKNTLFMQLMASAFAGIEIYAASVAQATAIGTALAIHDAWNSRHLPDDIIMLQPYYAGQPTI